MINGVTVLYEKIQAMPSGLGWAFLTMVLAVIIAAYAGDKNHDVMMLPMVLLIMFCIVYILSQVIDSEKYAGVIMDDTALFNEVVSAYHPVKREGDLWIMEVLNPSEK